MKINQLVFISLITLSFLFVFQLLCYNFPPSVYAQKSHHIEIASTPNNVVEHKIGSKKDEVGNFIQETSDGGYIIVGTKHFDKDTDVFLVKTDNSGNLLWNKTFGGKDNDVGYSLLKTSDGGFLVVGSTRSYGSSWDDVLLIKTDFKGRELWHKTYGNVFWEWGESILETQDGGIVVLGSTNYLSHGGYDVFLMKIDTDGNKLWSRTIGGSRDDWGRSIQETMDGGYIIVGTTKSYDSGDNDVFLVKTNSNGREVWVKTIGYSGDDRGYTIQKTLDGGFIIVGTTDSIGSGSKDVYLIKTDLNGNIIWEKTFGSNMEEWGYSVKQLDVGHFVVVGKTTSFGEGSFDALLIIADADGNLLMNKTFGGPSYDEAKDIISSSDGSLVITGTYTSGKNLDLYLAKIFFELLRAHAEPSPEPSPRPTVWDFIPGFPYESILIGLIVSIILIWLFQSKR